MLSEYISNMCFNLQEYCHRTAVSKEHDSDADLTDYMLLALYCCSRPDTHVGNTYTDASGALHLPAIWLQPTSQGFIAR